MTFLVAPAVDASRNKGEQVLVTTIHEQLKARLNQYMLPGGYQLVHSLPTLARRQAESMTVARRGVGPGVPRPPKREAPSGEGETQHRTKGADILASFFNQFRKILKLGPSQPIEPTSNFV